MGGEKEGQVGQAFRERPAGGGLYGSGGGGLEGKGLRWDSWGDAWVDMGTS